MIKIVMSDNTEVLVSPIGAGGAFEAQAGTAEVVVRLQEAVARGAQFLQESAQVVRARLSDIAPDELKVEVGLGISAEGSIVVAKGKAEASIAITVVWRKPSSASLDAKEAKRSV